MSALKVSWTRKALNTSDRARSDLVARLEMLRKYFPESKPEMKIGITRAYDGLAFQSNAGDVKLMVDLHRWKNGLWKFPTYWTLAHEMMHLAQFNTKGIPSGERACDIYALARLPPKLIDDSPSYLVVPPAIRRRWSRRYASLAHELALEALRRRSNGLRRYASWWEQEFERLTDGDV